MAATYRTILLALALTASSALSAQTTQDDAPPTATVEGAVINTQNSRGISRASVTLFGLKGSGSKSTRADGNGHFLFERVPAGRYRLIAEQTGYFSDNRRPNSEPVFEISPGQHVRNMPVRLLPTAAIAGAILDEYNDPVQHVEVTLLSMQTRLGQMYLAQAGKTVTDDRGQYRISGLHPGKYYLVAEYKHVVTASITDAITTLVDEQMTQNAAARRNGKRTDAQPPDPAQFLPEAAYSYPPLFYPNTSDFQQAQTLRLSPGDEIPANFLMVSAPVVSIRGIVTNGMTGAPASAAVSAFWSEYMQAEGIPAKANETTGEFLIRGVAPGMYTLRASFTEDKQEYLGEQTVEVGIQGAQNVVIAGMPAFVAAGHVTVPDEIRRNPISRVAIEFVGEGLTPRIRVNTALPKMEFDVQLQPDHRYRAVVRNLPEDYYLKSVALSGHEVSPDNILVSGRSGQVELTLSAAGGHIEGILLDSKGEPVRGSILLAPDVPQPGPAELFRRTTADLKGKFTLRGVAPGSYRLIGVDMLNLDAEISSPEFQRTIGNLGQSLIVEESGKYTVTVNLSAIENQE